MAVLSTSMFFSLFFISARFLSLVMMTLKLGMIYMLEMTK